MNPTKSYEQMQRSELDGRELEASVLSRAARKLTRCAQAWDRKDSREFKEEFQDALEFTQRLWTFLQVEMANPEHQMPPALRRSIFQLSRYVDRTIIKLHAGGTLQELKSLIQLNQEIAAGLLANRTSENVGPPAESGALQKTPIGLLG